MLLFFILYLKTKKNNSIRIQQTGAVVTETSRPFLVVVFSEILKDLDFAHLKMVSESFNKAIDKITGDDAAGLQELLKSREVEIEEEDDHGMTLLQHAAFKGKKDLCQLLLDLVHIN